MRVMVLMGLLRIEVAVDISIVLSKLQVVCG